ncbi:50S ribosomal protein L10 [Candidatus Woesearchaeota archaeon]|nr:50S ribosomal protein L10 [Candidatus Woesearchaeota archaeon]
MVSEAKKQLVLQLVKDIQNYPVIGLVDMQNLPAQQLQKMRTMLKSKDIKICMTKKKLLHRALEESNKENIGQLAEKIKGMPALMLGKSNPFTLYSIIQKNKSEASAKPGQIVPKDILVKAGPTKFAPGPIISELAAVGIKTRVEGGKLAIIADTRIAKEGEVISPKLSDTLKRLDIKPMEIGLNLVAVWENGMVFEAKQLHIDEAEYVQNITQAAQWAVNLALECAYPTNEIIELLLQKAFQESKTVALEGNILTKETESEILARAESQALAVKEAGNIEAEIEPKAPEPKSEEPVHPSFGHVKQDQTKELFDHLQKDGTLRNVKVTIKEEKNRSK